MATLDDFSPAELLSVLEFYRAAGVDIAIGDEPVDRFAQNQQARRALTTQERPALPVQQTSRAPDALVNSDPAEARALAREARTLDELRALLDAYDGCALKMRATQLVFADGNPQADIMLIGEAPGGDEDRVGRPFVGKSGQLLDRMLAAIGLDRTKVYIANTVPWRPPGNRTPTPEETALCLPFLQRQVELVAPKIIMSLGGPATQVVFQTSIGILKMRGKWQGVSVGEHQAEAIATLHPAYLLRSPGAKHHAWRDMLALRGKIDELGLSMV